MKPVAKRLLEILLFLLLFVTVLTAAALTAAAEGETVTLKHTGTGIEVDVKADALPDGAVLNVTVGRTLQTNSGGVTDYLDPSLYWQTVSISIGGKAGYTGAATARIPLINTSSGAVKDVREILLPPDPGNPNQLTDVAFSVAENVLTVELTLPATVYIGATTSTVVAVPRDGVEEYEPGVWDSIGEWFDGVRDWYDDLLKPTKTKFNDFLQSDWTSVYTAFLLPIVNTIYVIVYPFGIFILLISWTAGVSAAGFTMNLDPKNKYSILRAVMQLMVGIILLSVTPQLLMLIFSLCNGIKTQIVSNVQVQAGHSFILLIFQLKIYLNLAHIALIQCISPLFIGTSAGSEGIRRSAVNFFREYGLRCMELIIVMIYILLIDALQERFSFHNILTLIVLAFSVFSIDKKVEKLFH